MSQDRFYGSLLEFSEKKMATSSYMYFLTLVKGRFVNKKVKLQYIVFENRYFYAVEIKIIIYGLWEQAFLYMIGKSSLFWYSLNLPIFCCFICVPIFSFLYFFAIYSFLLPISLFFHFCHLFFFCCQFLYSFIFAISTFYVVANFLYSVIFDIFSLSCLISLFLPVPVIIEQLKKWDSTKARIRKCPHICQFAGKADNFLLNKNINVYTYL